MRQRKTMLVMPRPRRERVHVCACIYPSYKSVNVLLLVCCYNDDANDSWLTKSFVALVCACVCVVVVLWCKHLRKIKAS